MAPIAVCQLSVGVSETFVKPLGGRFNVGAAGSPVGKRSTYCEGPSLNVACARMCPLLLMPIPLVTFQPPGTRAFRRTVPSAAFQIHPPRVLYPTTIPLLLMHPPRVNSE